DLGARSENLAVDESFERGLLNLADRTAIQFELLDIRGRHRGRRPRLGHEKPVRILIVPGGTRVGKPRWLRILMITGESSMAEKRC
ncbi:MAG TPA: hypothetical protein VEG60_04015, partial [Candidatus Binatia bacterium]|nr:hypothetical protein [Candidatus Binatia bacterium]